MESCTNCEKSSSDLHINKRAPQVWDAALRAVCQARGVQSMPSFVHLMRLSVGGLSRKPVRARCLTDAPWDPRPATPARPPAHCHVKTAAESPFD